MKVHCFGCGRNFPVSAANIKIYGPYVEVNCPYCAHIYEDKFLNFVDKQVGGHSAQSPRDAARMIALAQFVELNCSDYYKEKGLRHGKKKVRNV